MKTGKESQPKKVRKGSASPRNRRKSSASNAEVIGTKDQAGREQLRTTMAKEAALVSLEKNLGMIEPTAREVGVSSKTIRKWIREDASFAQSVGDLRAASLDFVESKMMEAIKQWKPGAAQLVMFYLKTMGRERGYTERIDIQTKHEGTIIVDFKRAV